MLRVLGNVNDEADDGRRELLAANGARFGESLRRDRAGNRFGLPAKDRSGRLDETEPADLAALLRKINAAAAPIA